ncbi:hypothetical protein KC318_g64 [Hortaea werneckii]|nr:hypothetical protein KC334_g61 [Hortaea werneckii]KAI7028403.1 hypothetical protein KC355_g63 [Hortaea werneckii]KAI7676766.1 hypothetical protein KC318_g64 [Hortaea werneckii]
MFVRPRPGSLTERQHQRAERLELSLVVVFVDGGRTSCLGSQLFSAGPAMKGIRGREEPFCARLSEQGTQAGPYPGTQSGKPELMGIIPITPSSTVESTGPWDERRRKKKKKRLPDFQSSSTPGKRSTNQHIRDQQLCPTGRGQIPAMTRANHSSGFQSSYPRARQGSSASVGTPWRLGIPGGEESLGVPVGRQRRVTCSSPMESHGGGVIGARFRTEEDGILRRWCLDMVQGCGHTACQVGVADHPIATGCPVRYLHVDVGQYVRFLCPALSVSGKVPTVVLPSSTGPSQPHWHAAMRFRVFGSCGRYC